MKFRTVQRLAVHFTIIQCSFAWNVPLPPIDFVEQFSATHDKSFVVTYLPNEGDNSQEIIAHSRMLVKNLYTTVFSIFTHL